MPSPRMWKLREPSLTALMGDRSKRESIRVSVEKWPPQHTQPESELVKAIVNRKAAASRVQTPHWGLRMVNTSLNCSECRMVLDEMTEYWIRETRVTGATCTHRDRFHWIVRVLTLAAGLGQTLFSIYPFRATSKELNSQIHLHRASIHQMIIRLWHFL